MGNRLPEERQTVFFSNHAWQKKVAKDNKDPKILKYLKNTFQSRTIIGKRTIRKKYYQIIIYISGPSIYFVTQTNLLIDHWTTEVTVEDSMESCSKKVMNKSEMETDICILMA